MSEGLLPCPMCGANGNLESAIVDPKRQIHRIICGAWINCDCTMEDWEDSIEKAAVAWNTRYHAPEYIAQLIELEAQERMKTQPYHDINAARHAVCLEVDMLVMGEMAKEGTK